MCKKFSGEKHDHWTAIDIMELQANKLPGYFLIQDKPGKEQAERLMAYYNGIRSLETMRNMVKEMSDHFGTTKTVAKTRLVDFGYKEARGILQSANGGRVPAYMSTLEDNETYTVDEADGIREYLRNAEFRKLINTGQYLYIEGHYCLNDSKYINFDQFGYRRLSPYARTHMDECCLVFKKVYRKSVFQMVGGLIQKGSGRGRQEVQYPDRKIVGFDLSEAEPIVKGYGKE